MPATFDQLVRLAKTELELYYIECDCRMSFDEELQFLIAKMNEYAYNIDS